jgi:peroxiredoxin
MGKMFVLSFLLSVAVATGAFSQSASKKKYEIIGTTMGYPDGTRIYLADPISGSPVFMDSTRIANNKFHFVGSIKGEAMNVFFQVGDLDEYKYFWLENKKITFQAKQGNFRDAVISGSKTETEQGQLDSALAKSAGRETDKPIYASFIRSHPNSLVSARILSFGHWGKDTVASLYSGLSEKSKNSLYGQIVKQFIDLNKEIVTGDHFVDFSQQNPKGKAIRLSDFHDKFVLLEFWASNCGPCREGNPELIRTYHEFKDRGFEILGVSLDGREEDWTQAIQYDKLPWENVSDLKGWQNAVAMIYGVWFLPNNFLIDKNGIIIAENLRGEALRNKLTEVLK